MVNVSMMYYLTAVPLKAFNANAASRKAYRYLGNIKNSFAKLSLEEKYFKMSPIIAKELSG